MHHSRLVLALSALVMSGAAGAALKPIDGAIRPADGKSVAVYKTTPQGDLKINLYFPQDWKPGDRRPGIVFFFGGGFVSGTPGQFTSTAEYLATRGLVAGSAEYRIKNKHQTGPEKSIEDAKSAVRWMRMNAANLGIDPHKVIAGGGSAGGTCAAFAAYNTTFEPEGEDMSVSSIPDALVLYNPALGFAPDTGQYTAQEKQQANTLGAFIQSWKVTKGGPPAILFFGTDDHLAAGGRTFTEKLIAAGTRAEFYTAAGQKHGFFNDRPGTPWHAVVVRQTDLFLRSLGYLKGDPTIAIPDPKAVLEKRLP
jgi:acetyl esterase/lipase